MIPETLKLTNFMCYREIAPLSFEGFKLACLCGDNGSGKSTLLDAITWALWGKSRASSDDELVHIGEKEMAVELDFASGPNHYRVLRRYAKDRSGRSGKKLLELFIRDGEAVRSITGNSLGETQQKVIDILGLDYPTFINSAFIRQGHADEFTTKTAGDRKKVLSSILNLEIYDVLQLRAREHAKDREGKLKLLEQEISDIVKQLEHKEEYATLRAEKRSLLAGLSGQMAAAESSLSAAATRKQEILAEKKRLAELQQRKLQLDREASDCTRQAAAARSGIAETGSIIGRREEIEAGYTSLGDLQKQNEEANLRLQSLLQLTNEKTALERKIEAARSELASEARLKEAQATQLDKRRQGLSLLETQLSQAKAGLEKLAQFELQVEADREKLQHLTSDLSTRRNAGQSINEDIKLIKEKLSLLSESGACCPLCESEIGEDGRRKIAAKYQAEMAEKAQLFRNNQTAMTQTETERAALDRSLRQKETYLRAERPKLQGLSARLGKDIEDIRQSEGELASLHEAVTSLKQRLAGNDFAPPEQSALSAVQTRIATLGYDRDVHQRLREQLAKLAPFESLRQKLRQAEQERLHLQKELQRLEEAAARNGLLMQELSRSLSASEKETSGEANVDEQMRLCRDQLAGLKSSRAEEERRLWELEAALKKCEEMESRSQQKREETAEISRQVYVDATLADAFGKRGIQAFIIESALPELQNEANELLSRMTDNRMTLKIETLKEYRTKQEDGRLQETLEIKIGDELGTRNYEMFSGGEAFRINFALRVALSKLLARRAGAPLRTLIIDEGFGSQDARGIDSLIEAITSIQDDFDRIIVITHMEEIKDQFPVRINVVKSGTGSRVFVS